MAKGTTFKDAVHNVTWHSNTDLDLIQQSVIVAPAAPKTTLIDVPGANGSKDFTEALGAVRYYDREITWTFALYPGDDWCAKIAEVSNALNGKRLQITLDEDPDWYYDGRVAVTEHSVDRLLKQITIVATCSPYKLYKTTSSASFSNLTTSAHNFYLDVGDMPLIPTFTVGQDDTILTKGSTSVTLPFGIWSPPEFVLQGENVNIKARLASGSGGTISISWRRGSL